MRPVFFKIIHMCMYFSGALITGEHSKTSPKTKLHACQLHGGGRG